MVCFHNQSAVEGWWDGTPVNRLARFASHPYVAAMSTLLSRITIDPEICHGKPAIRHLRYPVESLLEYLVAGDTYEDLLAEFPDLEREDLQACLEFAAQSLKLKSQHLVLA